MAKYNKSMQVIPLLIEEPTLTLAAARAQRNVNLKEKLPPMVRGRVAHSIGFMVELDLDPTFTTAPDQVGNANSLRSVQFTAEGGRLMVQGAGGGFQGPDLRALEAYENSGRLVTPDPDLNGGSTNNFYSTRVLDFGPGGFIGNPSDFAMPNVLMDTAVLSLEAPALTDISADTTAGTVIQRTFVLMIPLQSIRIPPKVEVRAFSVSGNALELGERALYLSLFYCDSASHGAIAGGDFNNFTLVDRDGPVFNSVPAEILGRQYAAQNAAGQFGIIQGEPRAAQDDNYKVVNGATPTALVSPTAAYQAVLWNPDGARINKVEVEGPIRLTHDGTQATAYAICRRILPRGEKEATELAIVAFSKLGLKFTGGKVKTQSKQPFRNGRRIEYMPWDFGYAAAA